MDSSICGILGCDKVANSPFLDFSNIGGIIRFGVATIFAIIIIYGILMVIKATLKIIRSEGDSAKMQEGYSIVKGVYIGIGIIFVGIIGMVIVLAFFNAGEITNTNPTPPSGLNIPL